MTEFDPNRYAVIDTKNPREIVMLRGKGCQWRRLPLLRLSSRFLTGSSSQRSAQCPQNYLKSADAITSWKSSIPAALWIFRQLR